MYSASVVDNTFSLCNFEDYTIGHLVNLIKKPLLLKANLKLDDSERFYPPAKSVLA